MEFPSFLNVSIKPAKYLFEIKTETNTIIPIRGVEVELLDILAEALSFEYRLFVPADNEWGKQQSNGSWTGVIGMISRGEADLGIATLGVTEPRSTAVDFTVAYSSQDTTFATLMPQRLPKGLAFLLTFDLYVWLWFLASVLVVPVALKVVLKRKHSQTHLFFKVFGGLFSEQMNLRCGDMKERVLMGSWLLGSFVMCISYTAVLSAFLTIPLYEKAVGTVQELAVAVVDGRYRCVVTRGTLAHSLFFNNEQESIRNIGDHIKRNEKTWMRSSNGPSRKQLIEEGRTAVVGPRTSFLLDFGKEVSVTKFLSQDSFAITYNAIALRPGFCCKKALDVCVRRIYESGLYEFHFNSALFRAASSSISEIPQEEEISIHLQDIAWTFILLGIGYVSGIVSLFIEIMLARYDLKDHTGLCFVSESKDEYLQHDIKRFLKKRLGSKRIRS